MPLALRRHLAAKAFARSAAYEAAIANWFASEAADATPQWRTFGGTLAQELRYGENPHQRAALYRTGDARRGVATARQVQGKELSYNNIQDADAALELAAEFDPARSAAVVIVKHANPCGVAAGRDDGRCAPPGAALRSGVGLWRHRRGQSHPGWRGGG